MEVNEALAVGPDEGGGGGGVRLIARTRERRNGMSKLDQYGQGYIAVAIIMLVVFIIGGLMLYGLVYFNDPFHYFRQWIKSDGKEGQEPSPNAISPLKLWNNRNQLLGKEVVVVVKGSGGILYSEVRPDNLYYWTGDYSIMHKDENITQDVGIMLVAMPLEYEQWDYWEESIYLFGKEDQTQYADKTWNWWMDKLQITGVLTTITFNYNERHWEFGVPQSHVWYEWKSVNLWALEVTDMEVLAHWPYS